MTDEKDELMEAHGLEEDVAERVQELIDEGVGEDAAIDPGSNA